MTLEQAFECPVTLVRLRSAPLGMLLEAFCKSLLERGFSRSSVRRHLSNVAHLNGYLRRPVARMRQTVTAKEIQGFCEEYASGCPHRGPLEAHLRCVRHSVNRFAEYLRGEGRLVATPERAIYQPLLEAYLQWMQRFQHAASGTLERRANSVRRDTESGRRDYAILQLLYTYGVRGGQVRALRLQEVDWAQDQILFKASKHGKDVRLPLTVDVGESLLDYLRNARPACSCPEVFLTCRAPYHPLPHSNTLSAIVQRSIRAAGIDLPRAGAHAFRHGFATRMLQQGHSLKAIADLLGHRHLSTTFIYTKVDFHALKQVALEWPQEACE